MTSPKRDIADILGETIHRTMCYRGYETPVCRSDYGDGATMARELDRLNLTLAVKERKS